MRIGRFAFLALAILLACTSGGQCKTVYLKAAGNDSSDGLSWMTAKKTLSSALRAASAGDEVWVATGSYSGVQLSKNIALYGGFVGTETERAERNWRQNIAAINYLPCSGLSTSARIDGFAFTSSGITCSSSSPTIVNNLVTGCTTGIQCQSGSSPLIANNMIIGNTNRGIDCTADSFPQILNNTIAFNGATSDGGGIYIGPTTLYVASAPKIINNIIAYNSSGIYRGENKGTPFVPSHNCVYANDAFDYSGLPDPPATSGNISVDPELVSPRYGQARIQPSSPCRDAGDDAVTGADWTDIDGQLRLQGAHVDIGADESDGTTWSYTPTIVRVSADGDDTNDGSTWLLAKRTVQAGLDCAATHGGEVWVSSGTYNERISLRNYVYLYGGFAGSEEILTERNLSANVTVLDGQQGGSVVTISHCSRLSGIDGFTIQNGKATSYGGGIFVDGGSCSTISRNKVTGNTAQYGGGIYCSGGRIANNLITANASSKNGAGIYCSGNATIVNNTIALNCFAATMNGLQYSQGEGVFAYSCEPEMANNIVAYNAAGICGNGGTIHCRANCAYGNAGGDYILLTLDPADGNTSVDPKLACIGYKDVHIQPDSPCRNAGSDSYVLDDDTDVDGHARSSDGQVDIGAYESDGTLWQASLPGTVYVTPDGDDANDGSSWELAKKTVQAGIDAASLRYAEVWVRGGVYQEQIKMKPYSHVYGGFCGTETARSQRDWRINATVLDGDRRGRVVTAVGFGRGLSTVDGFTIRNGYASGADGGGVYCYNAAPTLIHDVITCNTSIVSGVNGGRGGGVFCDYSSVLVADCVVSGNDVTGGGGGLYLFRSSAELLNNTIVGNSATSGGGLSCVESQALVANTIVASNTSGLSVYLGSNPIVPVLKSNCIYGNRFYDYVSGLSDPTGTDGNISLDPELARADLGDVHIQPSSPCRDAGDNSFSPASDFDIDGQPRSADGHIDIGADECDGTQWSIPTEVVRVRPNGDDANDGTSWDRAKRTIQAGISAASATGGEVWVSAGTYNERIILRSFVRLYGGFDGSETLESERDWSVHPTILDGQGAGPVVTLESGSFGAVDGFTIRNGMGSASVGGGITASGSAGTISHNTLTGNAYSAVYCTGGSPLISENVVTGNLRGGIVCTSGAPDVVGNTICYNVPQGSYGGGGLSFTNCRGTILRNKIVGNSTVGDGGAIYCSGSYETVAPLVSDNLIFGNSASRGGAMFCSSSSPAVLNNTIVGNSALTYGSVSITGSCSPMLVNNIIAHNSAGVYDSGGSAYLRKNDVYNPDGFNYSGKALAGEGDISIDPELESIEYGRWRLQPDSPCKDAGDDSVVQSGQVDIDGQPRVQNGRVDIGADESDGSVPDSGPTVVRVSPDGVDDVEHDGSSWAQAKKTIQAGIDAAAISGGEVWVAAGTYSERIAMVAGVHAYGGFVGAETDRGARNPQKNASVVDGQALGSVVTMASSGYRLSRIDGFTIRGGSASMGGGVCCPCSSPIIANNAITGNAAIDKFGGQGAGVYCAYSLPLITGNLITGNTAPGSGVGGGVYCATSAPRMLGNTITSNTSNNGAGVYLSNVSGSTLSANTVASNTAGGDTGGVYLSGTSTVVSGNTITNNTGFATGGIYTYGTGTVVAGNLIAGNTARSSSSGAGGLNCSNSIVTNNTITGNTMQDSNSGPGGLRCSSSTLSNNAVTFNSTGIGGFSNTLRQNDVYGNVHGDYITVAPGSGDISADPLFVDRLAGNYHLRRESPCINAGWNDAPAIGEFDMDGQMRVQCGVIDIGADEYRQLPVDAKLAADGQPVDLDQMIVTAVFSDAFYAESEDRTTGVRVEKISSGLEVGARVRIAGNASSNNGGERCIVPTSITQSGSGVILPVFVTNRALGGGKLGYQDAVWGWRLADDGQGNLQRIWASETGLNNIGLLVTTTGTVTQLAPGWCVIDDGSGVGVKVVAPPGAAVVVTMDPSWQRVRVTGISSCELSGQELHRVLRVRTQSDISAF